MRILLCLAALLFAATASARCMSQYMAYWPPPDTQVGTLPTILIEGMGRHQATVKGLKGVSLVAPGHHVALEKIATHAGAFRVTQTVWTPKEALKPGKTYTLVVQDQSKTWRPTEYAAGSAKKQRHRYTVAKTPRPSLAWAGAPVLRDSSLRHFGCGPSINQHVELPTTRADGVVEVQLTQANMTQTYVLPLPTQGALALGHGMCSGPFRVGGAGEFEATFSLIDGATIKRATAQTVTFPAVSDAGLRGHK